MSEKTDDPILPARDAKLLSRVHQLAAIKKLRDWAAAAIRSAVEGQKLQTYVDIDQPGDGVWPIIEDELVAKGYKVTRSYDSRENQHRLLIDWSEA